MTGRMTMSAVNLPWFYLVIVTHRHKCMRFATETSLASKWRALSPSYRGGLRAPILRLIEAIVVRASDRHRQLPSYLHSATIFARLLTRSNETELEFRFGRAYRVVK